jgi:SH3-like domain-containing protein
MHRRWRILHGSLAGLALFWLMAETGWPEALPLPPEPQTGTHASPPSHGSSAKPAGAEKPLHPQTGKAPAPHGESTPPAKPAVAGTRAKPEAKPAAPTAAAANAAGKPAEKPPAPRAAGKAPAPHGKGTPPAKPAIAGTHGKPGGKPAAPAAAAANAAAKPAESPPAHTPAEHAAEPAKGSVTGLPLPRFAALRSDEVNLRAGPGTRYPIDWVYKRRDLPVEIEREFEVWRLVVDPEGMKGWMHQATLTGHRSCIVVGQERLLRRKPEDDAAPIARLKPGVIGHIMHCDAGADWCRVQVDAYRGWLKREEFWGSFKGEAIN